MIHILCNSLALYELFRTFAERNLIPIIIMSTYTSGEILKSVYQRISQGGQYRTKDLLPLVQKDCSLTDQQMQERTQGDTSLKVMKQVQWALFHLYGAGLIYKVSRGLYEIAPQKEHLLGLSEKDDLEDLVKKIYNSREKASNGKYTAPEQRTITKIQKLVPSLKDEGNDWRLQLCFLSTAPDRQSIITGLTTLLADAKDSGYEIDLEEILKRVDEELNKKYELVLEVKKKGAEMSKYNIYIGEVGCKKEDLTLIKLEPLAKSVYLAFLYEGKMSLMNFCKSSGEEDCTYRHIYVRMPGRRIAERDITGIEEDNLTQIISKTNKIISEAIGNDRIARQFTILRGEDEGDEHEANYPYSIKASSQSIKDTIKKHFRLN